MAVDEVVESIPPTGPGSRKRRRWFLGVTGFLLAALLVTFREVLLPFLLAIVLAYVISPLVEVLQRVKPAGRELPRWLVVLLIYTAILGGLTGLIAVSVPRLAAELTRLAKEAPTAVATVRNEWLPELERRLRVTTALYLEAEEASDEPVGTSAPAGDLAQGTGAEVPQVVPPTSSAIRIEPRAEGGFDVVLPERGLQLTPDGDGYRIQARPPAEKAALDITGAITTALGRAMENTERTTVTVLHTAQQVIGALTRGILTFVMMLMLSAFLLITADSIFDFFRSLYPRRSRDNFDDLVRRIDRGLAGVVRGQLIICAVNGVLSGIGFYALGLKYWTFLTLLAAVMSIIPIFGSILSTVPAVLVALPEGLGLALLVLAWIVLIHQIEANFLNPKIMGDAARVHPVLVVFALLAGEHIAGIVGALLAVPVLSITQTLFLYLREQFLGVPRGTTIPPGSPSPEKELIAALGTEAATVAEPQRK